MSPVVIQNAVKSFRQGDRVVRALAGVDLEVRQGQFLAVMGASGSGKSTLLHLIAGLTSPDAGAVRVAGTDLAALNDRMLTLFRRRQIGLVFQSFNLIPTLTAEENVRLPLMLDGCNARTADVKVHRLLQQLGLVDRSDHRPDALSGGEQQRVAIARALVSDPAVILADEPTGNLDSASGRSVCELLRELSLAAGRTIVMVTHEPSVATFAQEVVALRDGIVVARFGTDAMDAEQLALKYQEAQKARV